MLLKLNTFPAYIKMTILSNIDLKILIMKKSPPPTFYPGLNTFFVVAFH
jgi:hypothetical protein